MDHSNLVGVFKRLLRDQCRLGVDLDTSFRRLSLAHHPDKQGGTAAKFQALTAAFDELKAEGVSPQKPGPEPDFFAEFMAEKSVKVEVNSAVQKFLGVAKEHYQLLQNNGTLAGHYLINAALSQQEVPDCVREAFADVIRTSPDFTSNRIWATLSQSLYQLIEGGGFVKWDGDSDLWWSSYQFLAIFLRIYLVKVGTRSMFIKTYDDSQDYPAVNAVTGLEEMPLSNFTAGFCSGCYVPVAPKTGAVKTVKVAKWFVDAGYCMEKQTASMARNSLTNLCTFTGLQYDGSKAVFAGDFPIKMENGTFNHKTTFTYIDQTVRGNEQADLPPSNGMQPLARLLTRWYFLCGRDEGQFLYKMCAKTWEYLAMLEKVPVITIQLGPEGTGKSMMHAEWDGRVMLGEGQYVEVPTLRELIKGGSSGENALEQNRKLKVVNDASTEGIKKGSVLWNSLKTLCTEESTTVKSLFKDRKKGVDVASIVLISNVMDAFDE